uniref:Uncharacterized protein n=1 Tax=Lepeophtheirus salmonis TaxID=72036 RepID=A0A0K2TXM4_LEPSM
MNNWGRLKCKKRQYSVKGLFKDQSAKIATRRLSILSVVVSLLLFRFCWSFVYN